MMMEEKPLIKHGWLRAMIFAFSFLAILLSVNQASNSLFGSPGVETSAATGGVINFHLWLQITVFLLVSLLTVFCLRKFIDKKSFISLGLLVQKNSSHAAVGFFLGILLLGIGTLFLVFNNNLQWTNITFHGKEFFTGIIMMCFVAFSEELVFRGYILNNLMQSTNKWTALVLSALIFALFHGNNPGISFLPLLNIFLAGLILGVNYIFTRNLWFGILFHFIWNFYQGPVLGYKVSGVQMGSLLEQQLTGNPLLTGGAFGFEGSVINCILTLLSFLLLAWVYKKKGLKFEV